VEETTGNRNDVLVFAINNKQQVIVKTIINYYVQCLPARLMNQQQTPDQNGILLVGFKVFVGEGRRKTGELGILLLEYI